MRAHMKALVSTFIKKAFKIDGETFSPETEAKLDRGAELIIVVAKWSVKIFVVVTLFMLIFGDSRYITGEVPLIWRIQYEWKHLINDILFHIFDTDLPEGGYR